MAPRRGTTIFWKVVLSSTREHKKQGPRHLGKHQTLSKKAFQRTSTKKYCFFSDFAQDFLRAITKYTTSAEVINDNCFYIQRGIPYTQKHKHCLQIIIITI